MTPDRDWISFRDLTSICNQTYWSNHQDEESTKKVINTILDLHIKSTPQRALYDLQSKIQRHDGKLLRSCLKFSEINRECKLITRFLWYIFSPTGSTRDTSDNVSKLHVLFFLRNVNRWRESRVKISSVTGELNIATPVKQVKSCIVCSKSTSGHVRLMKNVALKAFS